MLTKRPILVELTSNGWQVSCPACKCKHEFTSKDWKFNGDFEKPTFSRAMRAETNSPEHPLYDPKHPSAVCHFFVKSGMLDYQADCTHKLRGRVVPMEPVDTHV